MNSIAKYIDHTLLRPDATMDEIDDLCLEAKKYKFASVCVNPYWVHNCAQILKDSDVKVCTVIGFPLGANEPEIKAREAQLAAFHGADEIDMVMNIGKIKMSNPGPVIEEIELVRKTIPDRILKVILETCLLSRSQIIIACECARLAAADFVKTSTGLSTGGATIEAVELMQKSVSGELEVKASGGIRDLATARAMLNAGATRLGMSSSVAVMQEELNENKHLD